MAKKKRAAKKVVSRKTSAKKSAAKKSPAKRSPAVKKRPAKKSLDDESLELPDLAEIRGVASFDTDESTVLVLSSCAKVSDALQKHAKLKSKLRNAVGKTVTIRGQSYLVYQLKGHPWVTINGFTGGDPRPSSASAGLKETAQALSKSLATRVLYYGNSDTSCVTEYDLFDRGKPIEHFDDFDGIRFKSNLRDVEPPEDGPAIYEFIAAFIEEQDAFVNGWSHFLFDGWRYNSGDKVTLDFDGALTKGIFTGFDFISA
jgi:hypothetical protein